MKDTDAIGILQAFSLITAEKDDETYSMHRLVQLSTQSWLVLQNKREFWEAEVLDLLSREFPNGDYENRAKCITLLPHARAVLNYKPVSDSSLLHRATLLHNLADFDYI